MGHGASGRDGHAGRGRAVHARHAQCLDDLFGRRRARPGLRAHGQFGCGLLQRQQRDYEHPYSTALVALDITSGEVAWVFQTVHNDVWDYDLGSQGTLADFPMERARASRLSFCRPNRAISSCLTGAPASRSPRCRSARCRPASCPTNSCRRLSPSRSACRHSPSPSSPNATPGAFHPWISSGAGFNSCSPTTRDVHPPSVERPFIQYPGYNGGNDWGGGSLDPERGIFVANYTDLPMRDQLIRREEADERHGAAGRAGWDDRFRRAGAPGRLSLRHLDQAMAQRPDRYPLHPATLRRNHGHRPGHP